MGPVVSIGIPVFNGADYLTQALDSVLAQTYESLQVVICDNLSTDSTPDICEEYRRKDPRIEFHSNTENIGIFGNFHRTLELARGKYFTWLSHDDAFEPTLIERQVALLEANPDVLICASDVKLIDELGRSIGEMNLADIYPDVGWRRARRSFFVHPPSNVFMSICGLYVAETVKRIGPPRPIWKDVTLGNEPSYLARFAFEGRIVAIPEPLKVVRRQKQSVSTQEKGGEGVWENVLRTIQTRKVLTRLVLRSGLSLYDKALLLIETFCYNTKAILYSIPRHTIGGLRHRAKEVASPNP